MARKIQFEVTADAPSPDAAPAPAAESASKAPSLSAMAKSLHAAAAASIREIDPRLIDDSQFQDRITDDDSDIADLALSIQTQGQLIPILVSPISGGRFRIIYGRRRLAALRQLGLAAKALVRDLDEDQAIIAQGQENTFRKDLSWIEKAMFARQLIEAGKADDLVCDTLNIDQKARRSGDKLTGLSRMRQVMGRLEPLLVDAIGPAPKIGRDRWYELAQMLDRKGFPPGNQSDFVSQMIQARNDGIVSDDRFLQLEKTIGDLQNSSPRSRAATSSARIAGIGSVNVTARSAVITILGRDAEDLRSWIGDHPDEALQALAAAQKTFVQQQ